MKLGHSIHHCFYNILSLVSCPGNSSFKTNKTGFWHYPTRCKEVKKVLNRCSSVHFFFFLRIFFPTLKSQWFLDPPQSPSSCICHTLMVWSRSFMLSVVGRLGRTAGIVCRTTWTLTKCLHVSGVSSHRLDFPDTFVWLFLSVFLAGKGHNKSKQTRNNQNKNKYPLKLHRNRVDIVYKYRKSAFWLMCLP